VVSNRRFACRSIVSQIGEVRLKPDATTDTHKPDAATGIVSYVASGFSRTSGEVSSVSARHIDILPTILEAAAQAIPADLPGRSWLPAAERRDGTAPRPVYFEALSAQLNRGWAPLTGVLVDRDKYIALPMAERYVLASDPGERTNLLDAPPIGIVRSSQPLATFTPPRPARASPRMPTRWRSCDRSAMCPGERLRKRPTARTTIRKSLSRSTKRCIAPWRRSAPAAPRTRSRSICRSQLYCDASRKRWWMSRNRCLSTSRCFDTVSFANTIRTPNSA
jgi:hypothetical protein